MRKEFCPLLLWSTTLLALHWQLFFIPCVLLCLLQPGWCWDKILLIFIIFISYNGSWLIISLWPWFSSASSSLFITLALWAGMLGMKTGNNEHRYTMKVQAGLLIKFACPTFLTCKDKLSWTIKKGGNNVKTIIRKGQADSSKSRWITFVGGHWVNWPCVCQVLDLEECRWMEFDLLLLGLHPSFQDSNIPANPEQLQICARENCSVCFVFWRCFVFLRTVRTAGLSYWSLI